MIKIVCFGVRETEVPYFHKLNEKFGYELKLVTENLTHENVEEAIGAEAIMVRGNCKADRRNLEILKEHGLQYVLTRTVGFDHVDLEAVKDLGIEKQKKKIENRNKTKQKDFTVDATMFSKEVRNCTVGVLGTGRIGLTTAKLFKGLGAKVLGYDVFQSDAAKEVVEFKTLDEVIAESDIISIHMPFFKDSNYHIVNDDFISKMKDGAILVNTARGELQDLEAIIRGIESGKLGGFGTDVLEGEAGTFFKDLKGTTLQNPVFEKLVDLYPRVLITPHMGSYTDEALINMIEISYENLREYLNEGTCKNQIA